MCTGPYEGGELAKDEVDVPAIRDHFERQALGQEQPGTRSIEINCLSKKLVLLFACGAETTKRNTTFPFSWQASSTEPGVQL